MKPTKLIEDIILEASLDTRIPDGMIDLKNADHIQVVAEALYDACENEEIVNEFVSQFIKEGKYPERQAYNKDGWLVTFPSKEYRDAAIKKRTHFGSDPTHGKGGMNLYYKKKGKQKRQTQQVATQTAADAGKKAAVAKPASAAQPSPAAQPEKANDSETSSTDRATRLAKLAGAKKPEAPTAEPSAQEKPTAKEPSTDQPSAEPQKPVSPSTAPAIDVPVVTTPSEEYATVSKRFASQKKWTATEYGEYRDAEGNPVAVVGLSGEVVPIRSNDREEYKIFAEKSKP